MIDELMIKWFKYKMIDWLNDLMIEWFKDKMIERLEDKMIEWIYRLNDWFIK